MPLHLPWSIPGNTGGRVPLATNNTAPEPIYAWLCYSTSTNKVYRESLKSRVESPSMSGNEYRVQSPWRKCGVHASLASTTSWPALASHQLASRQLAPARLSPAARAGWRFAGASTAGRRNGIRRDTRTRRCTPWARSSLLSAPARGGRGTHRRGWCRCCRRYRRCRMRSRGVLRRRAFLFCWGLVRSRVGR